MTGGSAAFLLGDIGGTNVRLALGEMAAPGRMRLFAPLSYPGDRFAALEEAVSLYLDETGARDLDAVSLSLAGPVTDGRVRLTNRNWEVTQAGMMRASGADQAVLVNDFAAAAMSLPFLPREDFAALGGPPRADALWASADLRVSAVGPGTGLGHAMLINAETGFRALPTEGGHVGFAPWDEESWAVARDVTARFGRCSLEHLASGPGLANIHAALAGAPERVEAAEVQRLADAGDATAARALTLFCEILGAGAGDLALAAGARDGVFLMGGVAAKLAGPLQDGAFRARFEAKGDFSHYTRAIPTELVTARHAGLIGAAASLAPGLTAVTLEED